MSDTRPDNILDKFVTYSYQHYLLASNTTEVFRQLQNDKQLFKVLQKQSGGTITSVDYNANGNKSASVAMVVNSTIDSKFIIDSVSFKTYYVGGPENGEQIIASTLKMILREPNGIQFMNFLKKLINNDLQCGFDGIVFMLKTYFVGHTADGRTETIDIPPVTLMLSDLEATYDSSGGIYGATFFGMQNGASLLNVSMRYIKREKHYRTKDGTLGNLIKDLEVKVNAELKDAYDSIKSTKGKGRLVKYKFTIPTGWEKFQVRGISENYNEVFFPKEKGNVNDEKTSIDSKSGPQTVTIGNNVAVHDLVKKFLSLTDNVFDYAEHENKKSDEKQVQTDVRLYKISNNITSDDESLTIHYDITEYFLPKLPKDSNESARMFAKDWYLSDGKTPRYGMELDYLFSGKNTSIRSFDLKFKEGNMYLLSDYSANRSTQSNVGIGVENSTIDARGATVQPDERNDVVDVYDNTREKDPILATQMSEEMQDGNIAINRANSRSRQKYTVDNSNLYSSFLQANVKIRGNPRLLTQNIKSIMPHEDSAYETELRKREELARRAVKQNADSEALTSVSSAGQAITPNGHLTEYYPQFVKFNIYEINTSKVGNFAIESDFWFKGWYWIMEVEHTFSGGDFEQTMKLASYNMYGIEDEGEQNV